MSIFAFPGFRVYNCSDVSSYTLKGKHWIKMKLDDDDDDNDDWCFTATLVHKVD